VSREGNEGRGCGRLISLPFWVAGGGQEHSKQGALAGPRTPRVGVTKASDMDIETKWENVHSLPRPPDSGPLLEASHASPESKCGAGCPSAVSACPVCVSPGLCPRHPAGSKGSK
jgi:hypothetical protein